VVKDEEVKVNQAKQYKWNDAKPPKDWPKRYFKALTELLLKLNDASFSEAQKQ